MIASFDNNNIYVSPNWSNNNPKPPPKDQFDKSYVIDTAKSTDILDSFGNVRYIVQLWSALSSFQNEQNENINLRVYQTKVTQVLPNELSTFLVIPENGYETNPYKAEEDFKTCVQRYQSLIKAEMKDFNDIDIYAKTIGYEVTKPECCMNCKWKKNVKVPGKDGKPIMKIECYNPVNQQKFTYAEAFPQLPHQGLNGYGPTWQKLPWQPNTPNYGNIPPPDWFMNRIFPTVDPMGKCTQFAFPDLSAIV